NAAVTGQEARFFQRRAQARLEVNESAGNAVANCTGLTGKTAACDKANNVKLANATGDFESLADDQALRTTRKVLRDVFAVHGDFTAAAGNPYTGNCVFAATGAISTAFGIEHGLAFNRSRINAYCFISNSVFQIRERFLGGHASIPSRL